MEQLTITEPYEGLFQMKINTGGKPFWCMFDYALMPTAPDSEIKIEPAAGADAETVRWFPHLLRGMLRGLERERDKGREYVGVHILICKVYTHEVDTTERGCEYYGVMFTRILSGRAVSIAAPL